jgi:hypothetical protein
MSYKSRTDASSDATNIKNLHATDGKIDAVELLQVHTNIIESSEWNDAENTLTDGATITWDWLTGREKVVTLGGNRTLAITNLPNDRVTYGTLRVIQDGTGGRTLTLPTNKNNGGTINTSANAESIISFRYNGSSLRISIGQYS